MESRSYLAVFAPGSLCLVPLPLTGELHFGPDKEGGLQVNEEAVARLGAKIFTRGGQTVVAELEGAAEEVVVNGERVDGARLLESGDVISTGQISMMLNRGRDLQAGPALLDMTQLDRRFTLELARASRHQRPLSLICVKLGGVESEDMGDVCDLITSGLRLIDLVGWNGTDEFIIILPETASGAEVPAGRILADLKALTPRAGLAYCPGDGKDAEALINGVRSAATAARPGTLKLLRDLGTTVKVGELVAVAIDPQMKNIYDQLHRVAHSDIPVLVLGETGTGKELVAQAVHGWSARAARPMVSINCAAITETLLESELFGHEKGAFTDAKKTKQGLFEVGNGGTVHLDEVSECSSQTQAKLLRVLEDGKVRRLGSVLERKVDVRVVASTNRNLLEEVAAGRFREDLYYRLAATTILVPPLRKRPLDLPVLARLLLEDACAEAGRQMTISEEAVQLLLDHRWPGNIRELKNLMRSLAAMVHEAVVRVEHLPHPMGATLTEASGGAHIQAPVALPAEEPTPEEFRPIAEEVAELEARRMAQALDRTEGNKTHAAKLINMPLRTFVTKHKKYGL